MSALYVYGFVDQPVKSFTVGGHRIEVVAAASLHAAVERVSERPALSEAFLRTQYEIVERLSDHAGAVLPARFGAFVKDDELNRLADLRGDDFRRGLEHVTGRVQMTVRLLSKKPPAHQRDETSVPLTGTEYLHRRQEAASSSLPEFAPPLCAAVGTLVVDTRVENQTRPALTTIVHLVPKAQASRYRRLLRQAARRLGDGVTVSISGPQPPFAFVPEIWP
jgi:Gas vesicle synthesis protein GvpL/GvpF